MSAPELKRLSRAELQALVAEDMGIPARDMDEMAIPTHVHGNPLIRWLFWRRYQSLSELADFRPDMSVLDFGCGIGAYLPTLCENAARVYAIDLFPHYAKKLVAMLDLAVTFVDDPAELADASLDLIMAADVLEHIDDLNGLLALLHAKLRPRGRLLVSGPTENLLYKLGRAVAGFAGKGHYHLTNIHQLRSGIAELGFEPRRSRCLPFAVPPHLFVIHEFEKPGA